MAIEEVGSQCANRSTLGLANRDSCPIRDPHPEIPGSHRRKHAHIPQCEWCGICKRGGIRYAIWAGTPGRTLPQPPSFIDADPFTKRADTPREGINSFVLTARASRRVMLDSESLQLPKVRLTLTSALVETLPLPNRPRPSVPAKGLWGVSTYDLSSRAPARGFGQSSGFRLCVLRLARTCCHPLCITVSWNFERVRCQERQASELGASRD